MLCMLKEMDFGILEWAVLGNVILLLILLVVLFYTICRLRKATMKNKLEDAVHSDTSDLVPQRYSTLCGLKSSNTRQNGVSIFASEDLRRFEKSRMSNFHLEKSSTPVITVASGSGPPAYISSTLPLPSKKSAMAGMKVPMHWTPPPPYWIALPPSMAPPSTAFQYVGPYTTLPAVLKKHQRCRHEQMRNGNLVSSSRRAIEPAPSSSPHHCMVVHNCGKKVHMQDDC